MVQSAILNSILKKLYQLGLILYLYFKRSEMSFLIVLIIFLIAPSEFKSKNINY